MVSSYGSSGSFGSRLRSKYIGHNTYTGRRINLRSKPTTIHGLVHKSDSNYSYSGSQFIRLPQAFNKNYCIICLRNLGTLIRELIKLLIYLVPMMYQVICTPVTNKLLNLL